MSARRRGRRDVSLAPQLEWRRLSARMLLIHPVREVGRLHPRHRRPADRGHARPGSGPGGAWSAWSSSSPSASRAGSPPATGSPRRRSSCAPACSPPDGGRTRPTGCAPSTSPRRSCTGCWGWPRSTSAPAVGRRGESLVLDALSRGPAGQLRAELLHRRTATAPAGSPPPRLRRRARSAPTGTVPWRTVRWWIALAPPR